MLKLVSKFAMDIFPSVIATILGAYIVNHYINNKSPATGATAAAVSTAEPKKAVSKADSKPAERSADLGHEPGVRAKGISEKAMIDKSAADKAPVEKANDKADRPSETASIPPVAPAAETRRHQPAREKEKAAKTAPTPAPAPAQAAEPAPAIAPVEAAVTPDANDLARAAIERLRGSEPAPRVQAAEPPKESPKAVEPPRVATAPAAPSPASVPVVAVPSLQPLPPPIVVSTPPAETPPAVARADDPLRPTPPADIPDPHAPLDLRADATTDQPAKRPSVADDVLSATKKLFNSVLPKQQQ